MESLESSLTSTDKQKLQKLNKIISYSEENEQLLFLIATDTKKLNKIFEEYFLQTLENSIKIVTLKDGVFKDIISNIEKYKDIYIIINLFDTKEYKKIMEEFQFKRDYIPQYRLKLIFLFTKEQYETFKLKAYDFFSFNNFFHLFIDNSFDFECDADLSELNDMITEYEEVKDTNISKQKRMKYLYDIANKAHDFSQYKISLNYLDKAYKLATKLKDMFMVANISGIKGDIYMNYGDLKKALEYQKESLHIAKKINYKKGISSSYGNIGHIYIDLENFELAISNYKKALDISIKEKDKHNEALALKDLGYFYQVKGKLDLSLEYLNKSLVIFKNLRDIKGEASTLGYLGGVYNNKGDFVLSLKYMKESLKNNKIIGFQNGILDNLISMGNIYTNTNDFDLALKYQKEALTIAKSLGFNGIIAKIEKSIKNIEKKRETE
ncbi:MAG: tetratricopeptide repeat protein [Campylobacterota bacterium]|nr:tetratricopeptide repeat protein [Campylobacterota bacterium]